MDISQNPNREDTTRINALYHDSIAAEYDGRMVIAHPKVKWFYQDIFTKKIFSVFKNKEQLSVLDLGCGTGYLEQFFSRENLDVYGIDISEKMLGMAKDKFPRYSFKKTDVYEFLDNNNQQFDMVISNSFYHHLVDYKEVFKKAALAVNPGGVFYMGLEPNHYSYRFLSPLKWVFRKFFHEQLAKHAARQLGDPKYEEVAEYQLFYGNGINIGQIRKNLKNFGFSHIDTIYTSRHLLAALCESSGINFFRFIPGWVLDHGGVLSRDFHLIAYKDAE